MLRPVESPTRYWFPAKRIGWGWGAPRVWQGWAVIALYVLVLLASALVLRGSPWRLAVVPLATVVLLVACLVKGEPVRWRRGGRG